MSAGYEDECEEIADLRRQLTAAREHARLAAADAARMMVILHNLEMAANTVDYCYLRRPENFAAALKSLNDEAANARAAIAKHTPCPHAYIDGDKCQSCGVVVEGQMYKTVQELRESEG